MKADTDKLIFQYYKAINYIPSDLIGKPSADFIWLDGIEWELKNKGCLTEHYERVKNDNTDILK